MLGLLKQEDSQFKTSSLENSYSKEIRERNKILAKYHWWNKIGFVSVETTTECQEKEKHLISLDFKIPQSNKVA